MTVIIGGPGVALSTTPLEVTLAGAQAFMIPSGQYLAEVGRYSLVQWLDPATGQWRARAPNIGAVPLVSDGTNVRLINSTGCPAGAILTAKGSAYTNGIGTVAITVSSGGSVWQSIVGGAFNSAVTVTTAGTYSYPPTIVFPAPPVAGGLRATATASLSAGGIGTVTFTNRGAGWTGPVPTSVALNNTSTASGGSFYNPQSTNIQIVQDPRDTGAGGGVITLNATLADSGAMTGVVCLDPGNTVLTSLPTLSFASGAASAIVIMNWTATGMTVGTATTSYGNAQPFLVIGAGLHNQSTAYAGDSNPSENLGIVRARNFQFEGTTSSAGAVTATGLVIDDAGFGLQRVPDGVVIPASGSAAVIPSAAAVVTITVGATTDTSWLQLLKL